MPRRLRRFISLSFREQWRSIEALLLPIVIGAGFRTVGVPKTQGWLRWWGLRGKPKGGATNATDAIRIAREAQGRIYRATGIRGSCLVRSLALWAMLTRDGVDVILRVGFRKREGKVEGHAWVEYNGSPLNESEAEASTFTVYEQPVSFDLWRKQQRPEPTL